MTGRVFAVVIFIVCTYILECRSYSCVQKNGRCKTGNCGDGLFPSGICTNDKTCCVNKSDKTCVDFGGVCIPFESKCPQVDGVSGRDGMTREILFGCRSNHYCCKGEVPEDPQTNRR